MLEPFGEVGINFSLHLLLLGKFAKIKKKKLSQKIDVKNIKIQVL